VGVPVSRKAAEDLEVDAIDLERSIDSVPGQ
jgi:hypothetical protein